MAQARLTRDGAVERELIIAAKARYTPREWGVVQFYYTCGLSHKEIARIFGVARPTITEAMAAIRRKAHGKRPYSDREPGVGAPQRKCRQG